MLLIMDFGIDFDIIDVPEIVIENAEYYQEEFFNWLFDKSVNHNYWWYENNKKFGCNYRSNAFVEWLNTNLLKESKTKAEIIANNIIDYDENLPILYF